MQRFQPLDDGQVAQSTSDPTPLLFGPHGTPANYRVVPPVNSSSWPLGRANDTSLTWFARRKALLNVHPLKLMFQTNSHTTRIVRVALAALTPERHGQSHPQRWALLQTKPSSDINWCFQSSLDDSVKNSHPSSVIPY